VLPLLVAPRQLCLPAGQERGRTIPVTSFGARQQYVWRPKGNWVGGNSRPDIAQGKRLGFMRVLDRPAVSSKPSKDGRGIS
jgi:hypothetical protein